LDFIVGMVVNEIFNRLFSRTTNNNIEITNEEKEFFYQKISEDPFSLRDAIRRIIGV
jgi:hypothetical protein